MVEMTMRDHKKIIRTALLRRFGFAPILKNIYIESRCGKTELERYVFSINGVRYMIEKAYNPNIIWIVRQL